MLELGQPLKQSLPKGRVPTVAETIPSQVEPRQGWGRRASLFSTAASGPGIKAEEGAAFPRPAREHTAAVAVINEKPSGSKRVVYVITELVEPAGGARQPAEVNTHGERHCWPGLAHKLPREGLRHSRRVLWLTRPVLQQPLSLYRRNSRQNI